MAHVDLILADHAQVADGRLFLSGGGLDGLRFDEAQPAGVPYPVTLSIAGTVTFPHDVTGVHTVAIEVVDADGQPPVDPGDGSRLPLGAALQVQFDETRLAVVGEDPVVPFAFNLVAAPFATAGRFQVSVVVDDEVAASRAFTLSVPTPLPPQLLGPVFGSGSGPTSFRLPGV